MSKKTDAKNKLAATWTKSFSRYLVSETFRLIDTQAYDETVDGIPDDLLTNYLADYIGAVVYQTLQEVPSEYEGDKEQLLEYTQARYLELKNGIQQAIALGFSEAMTAYANKHVDYYCQVTVLPEPTNKHPC